MRSAAFAEMTSWWTTTTTTAAILLTLGEARQGAAPRRTIAAVDFAVGPLHGTLRLTSDLPLEHGSVANLDLDQLRAALRLPEETKRRLRMLTRSVLETFGLYEPFRKQTKAIVLNNPVYYGEASGMVNYHKNLVSADALNATGAAAGRFEWKGLDGRRPTGRDERASLEQKWSRLIDDADVEPAASVAP